VTCYFCSRTDTVGYKLEAGILWLCAAHEAFLLVNLIRQARYEP
jgi:hypothetical protein